MSFSISSQGMWRSVLQDQFLHGAESPVSLLISQWDSNATAPNGVHIGFLSGSYSAYQEAAEDSLYLSRILGGVRVYGIHQDGNTDAEIRALINFWESCILQHPCGVILQYFYRDGSIVVDEALRRSAHRNHVVTVGISPHHIPEHPFFYYYVPQLIHLMGSMRYDVAAISQHVNSMEHFYRAEFQDPAFIPALQNAYMDFTNLWEEPTGVRLRWTPQIGEVANYYCNIGGLQIDAYGELERIDSDIPFADSIQRAVRLMRADAITPTDFFAKGQLYRALGFFISVMRVCSYIDLLVARTTSQGDVLSAIVSSEYVYASFWFLHSITQVFLFCFNGTLRFSRLRELALLAATLATYVNIADLINSVLIWRQPYFLPSLPIYGSFHLLWDSIRFFAPSWRACVYQTARRVVTLNQVQNDPQPHTIARINQAFYRNLQQIRVLLIVWFLFNLGVFGMGFDVVSSFDRLESRVGWLTRLALMISTVFYIQM